MKFNYGKMAILIKYSFESKSEKLRSKSKVVRHKEAKLRHEEGSVKLREESVTDKLSQLEKRTKVNYSILSS